jgi:nicotinate phosphoribosyltransferase
MTEQSLLLTDLYELSMLEAYAMHGMVDTAVFELFVANSRRSGAF